MDYTFSIQTFEMYYVFLVIKSDVIYTKHFVIISLRTCSFNDFFSSFLCKVCCIHCPSCVYVYRSVDRGMFGECGGAVTDWTAWQTLPGHSSHGTLHRTNLGMMRGPPLKSNVVLPIYKKNEQLRTCCIKMIMQLM